MIIGKNEVYFRHDNNDELFGVVPGACGNWGSGRSTYVSRTAPEEVNWNSSRFLDRLIEKSTTRSGKTVKFDENSESKSESDENSESNSESDEDVRQLRNTGVSRNLRMPIVPASSDQVSDARVWELIQQLGWVDQDEMVRTKRYVMNKFPKLVRRELIEGMLRFIPSLQEVFADIAVLQELPEENQMNFFFHLMGKGKQFYQFTLTSPEISLYLLFDNRVQNLFTFLRLSI